MENLIPRLLKFIDIEYDSQNEDTDKIWKMPIEERVAKGEAMANLHATFSYLSLPVVTSSGTSNTHAQSVVFRSDFNISKFREGASVIVSGHGVKFKGEIVSEEGNQIKVVMSQWDGFPSIRPDLKESTNWTIDKAQVDIRHILKSPISNLLSSPVKYNLIQGIIGGGLMPEIGPALRQKASNIAPTNLNPSQRQAFIEAYAAKNYYLIQGPPGTGKTYVLAYLAAAFANEGKNVLITAFTHTGINNALKKIKDVTGYNKTGKIGKKYQADILDDDEGSVSNGESLNAHGMTFSSRGVILGATAYAPNTKKLQGFHFDVVIFDEASQMNIALAVAAMSAGTKFIFIGDHKQLAPIISEKQTDKELTKSIFEHLFQFAPGTMLKTTYRMNETINRFPSQAFYGGALTTDPSVAARKLLYKKQPTQFNEALDPEKPDVFLEMTHNGMTTYCQEEAKLVASLAAEALNSGIPPKEIAIVTPYRAQVRLIQTELTRLMESSGINIKRVFIDTVERIQGQERDLILYSLVTSDKKLAVEKADFFLQPQRLNVALTRSRKKRIVVGSKAIFEMRSDNPGVQQWINLFRAYYDSATKVSVVTRSVDTSDIF